MIEFMHEVVARRESQPRPVFPTQYTPLYGGVFIPAHYNHLIYNCGSVIENVKVWWNTPSWRLMRAIFSTIGCEHRWVLDIVTSSSIRYEYYCMDCRSTQTQHIREDR
jgi:hypothetical protein